MTKSTADLSADHDELLQLLELDVVPSTRQLVSIATLLHEARDLVTNEARSRSLGVVVVAVDEHVFVNRTQVVQILGSLLRTAIRSAPEGGRVAITGQEIERELVFAVYDSGRTRERWRSFDYFAQEATHALGGRLRSAPPHGGNLALLSVPLFNDHN